MTISWLLLYLTYISYNPSGAKAGMPWESKVNITVADALVFPCDYHKASSISHTQSQNLNVSRLVLPLSLSNPLKLGVKSRVKM